MSTHSITHDVEDITQLVDDCVASLTLSEPFLCHKDSFSLHDSMAALQLTDPIMDCCELSASNYATPPPDTAGRRIFPRPPPTGLSDPFIKLPWDDLTAKDAAHFGVETLIRFEAFLAGASVGESSATCLYAHKAVVLDMERDLFPDGTRDQLVSGQIHAESVEQAVVNFFPKSVVYAFTLALLQITEDSRTIIVDADVFEEEDFALTTYDTLFFDANAPDALLPFMAFILQLAEGKESEIDDEHGKVIVLVLSFYAASLSLAKTLVRKARAVRWTSFGGKNQPNSCCVT